MYTLILHGAGPEAPDPVFAPYDMGRYKGTVEFTGTVGDSAPGTMWIQYVGISPGNIFVWSGTWQILGGEGGLEGIHGGGTWESSDNQNFTVYLEGNIHFAPN